MGTNSNNSSLGIDAMQQKLQHHRWPEVFV
jgi:hypothetical protein